MNKKWAWWIGGAIVILLVIEVGLVFWSRQDINANYTADTTNTNAALADQFPKEVTLRSEIKAVSAFNSLVPNGQTQSTKVFNSSSSLSEAYAYYKNFFESTAGWSIANKNLSKDHASLLAKNSAGFMVVNISAKGTGSVIDLSYLTK